MPVISSNKLNPNGVSCLCLLVDKLLIVEIIVVLVELVDFD
jgi:hypothetical protein